MAGNTLTGLFETTVLPAASSLAQPLTFRNSMVRKIYYQPTAEVGDYKQSVNVNIPSVNENDVIDIGNGPIQITDGSHTTVTMTVNNNPSWSRVIRDFDKVRTPIKFREFYLAPGIESVSRKINRQVCELVTATNFSTYSSVSGGSSVWTRPNVASMWANLVGGGVPMTPGDVHFVTNHVPYSTMIGDDTYKWIQQNIVGDNAAAMVQQTARLMPAYGADIDYDQQFRTPTSGTYAGLFFNKNAIALIPVVQPPSEAEHVMETVYTPEGTGLAFRIQFWYDPREQGHILHINSVFALTVVRPDYGSYGVTT